MAAAKVQQVTGRSSGTSFNMTMPGAVTGTNLITVAGSSWGSAITCTDNQSNTYTARSSPAAAATNYFARILSAHNVTGGATFTITVNNSPQDSKAACAVEWSGMDTAAPFDVQNTATGTSAAPAVSSGTMGQAEEVVVAVETYDGITPTTQTEPGSPWALIAEEEDAGTYTGHNAVWQIVSATSSVTSTWALGASRAWSAGIATFKAVAPSLEQTGFRYRNDNGSETTATWKAAQDAGATSPAGQALRGRAVIATTGDPSAGMRLKLKYRKVGDDGWRDLF